MEWAQQSTWPGTDPDDIDIVAMWAHPRDLKKPGRAARALGTNLEHVRIAALRHPDPAGHQPVRTARNTKIPRSALPSGQELLQASDAGLNLADLPSQSGCSTSTISIVARRQGVDFPTGSSQSYQINPQWLREQVELRQQTFRELAEILGASEQRLGQLAREMNITARGRGGPYHRHPLAQLGPPSAFPPELWAAFSGQGAVQRVERFLNLEGQPSMRAMTLRLGIYEGTLNRQIDLLERTTGIQLFERTKACRTNIFTPDGQRFATHARRLLTALNSKKPTPDTPEPTAITWRRRPAEPDNKDQMLK